MIYYILNYITAIYYNKEKLFLYNKRLERDQPCDMHTFSRNHHISRTHPHTKNLCSNLRKQSPLDGSCMNIKNHMGMETVGVDWICNTEHRNCR